MEDNQILKKIIENMIDDKVKPLNQRIEELEKRIDELEDIVADVPSDIIVP